MRSNVISMALQLAKPDMHYPILFNPSCSSPELGTRQKDRLSCSKHQKCYWLENFHKMMLLDSVCCFHAQCSGSPRWRWGTIWPSISGDIFDCHNEGDATGTQWAEITEMLLNILNAQRAPPPTTTTPQQSIIWPKSLPQWDFIT